MKANLSFLLVVLLFFSSYKGINKSQKKPMRLYHLNGYAQGTTYNIRYIATDSILTTGIANAIFNGLDASLSIYKKGSLINKFNESVYGIIADHHLKKVVLKSLEINKASHGLFDITIYPLVEAWGFGSKGKQKKLPDSSQIQKLKSCVSSSLLSFSNDFLHKRNPCVKIDVNGIAQGYSVDYFANWLVSKGVKNYMVEIGGEIKTGGRNEVNNRNWTIAIEQPGDNPESEPTRVLIGLKNGAVTTSGNYRKFYISNGEYISHLINPATGYSIHTNMISATVWAKDAITADGYDNVLMAMGMEKAMEFVANHKGLEAYLIYKKPGGAVADTATTAFTKMILPKK